jgi:hypothetical protein
MPSLTPAEIATSLTSGERRIMAGFPEQEASSQALGVRGTMLASLWHWLPRRSRGLTITPLLHRRYDEAESCFLYSLTDVGREVKRLLTS